MPIKLPSIFAPANSSALGFTDILSFEVSSLQHLSSFKHALPGHEIIMGRATPLCLRIGCPSTAVPQVHKGSVCICSAKRTR